MGKPRLKETKSPSASGKSLAQSSLVNGWTISHHISQTSKRNVEDRTHEVLTKQTNEMAEEAATAEHKEAGPGTWGGPLNPLPSPSAERGHAWISVVSELFTVSSTNK